MHAVAVALKQQPVSGPNAKDSANFDRHGDLAFARDFSLLLHDEFRFLTLAYFPYLAYCNRSRRTRPFLEPISKAACNGLGVKIINNSQGRDHQEEGNENESQIRDVCGGMRLVVFESARTCRPREFTSD